MPLPSGNPPWPPKRLERILPQMAVWSAWYGGDVQQLAHVYGGGNDPTTTNFFGSDKGGFKATVGRAMQRWFHGEPNRGPDRRIKLHLPIAADLCQSAADLLFADPPSLTIGEKQKKRADGTQASTPAQDYLNELAEDGLYTRFAEAVEIGAALGGVFLRVTWDDELSDKPFLTILDADCAVPEFTNSVLTAVTFWRIVAKNGKMVWRHLERHETDSAGVGFIIHGLYQGDDDTLGYQVPLTDQPETEDLVTAEHLDGVYSTESPGLAVVYLPHQRPNRLWRTDPLGRHLGRSVLAGVEQLMDALDETYTSWQRDLRLGKARLMMARSLVENNGAGSGATLNMDQEVYSAVNMMGDSRTNINELVQQVQFNIRVQEHADTAMNLLEQIVRSAGYSGHAFNIVAQAKGPKTATEIESQDRRSLLTRDRMIRLTAPEISKIVTKMLWVAKVIFHAPLDLTEGEDVQVTFSDGVQESQLSLAQTVLALRQAEAATTKTLVGIMHPDWDDDDVEEEAAGILAEQGRTVAAPDPHADPFGNPAGDANSNALENQ